MFYYSITNTKEESKHLPQRLKAEEKNLKLILLLDSATKTATYNFHKATTP